VAPTLVPPPAPTSLLGVQLFTGDDAAEPLGQLSDAGARWARVQVLWRYIEPTDTAPPSYDWTYLDGVFRRLILAGFTPIGTVYLHPEWAATTGCGRVDLVPLTRYQAFMAALAERYDGDGVADAPQSPRVRHWEVQNEPDFNPNQANGEADYGGCFGGDPSGYGQLLRSGYLGLKSASAAAVVIFGGVAYDRFYNVPGYTPVGPFDVHFTGDVIAWLKTNHGTESGYPFFDEVALHVYNDFRNYWDGIQPNDQELVGKVRRFRDEQLKRAGQFDFSGRPLGLSEASLPSMPADAFTERSEELQAVYPGQMLARSLAVGVKYTIWFSAEDNFSGDCANPYAWLTFGLLRSLAVYQAAQACSVNPLPDYYVEGEHEPKSALTAYQVAGEQLDGATLDQQLGTGQTGSSFIEAYRFQKSGGYRIVAFTDTGERLGRRASPPLTRVMTFSAAILPGWTDRIEVVDHLGNVSFRTGSSIPLTITQAPVYVRPVPLPLVLLARPGAGEAFRERIPTDYR
jgi:hypothetical protein